MFVLSFRRTESKTHFGQKDMRHVTEKAHWVKESVRGLRRMRREAARREAAWRSVEEMGQALECARTWAVGDRSRPMKQADVKPGVWP